MEGGFKTFAPAAPAPQPAHFHARLAGEKTGDRRVIQSKRGKNSGCRGDILHSFSLPLGPFRPSFICGIQFWHWIFDQSEICRKKAPNSNSGPEKRYTSITFAWQNRHIFWHHFLKSWHHILVTKLRLCGINVRSLFYLLFLKRCYNIFVTKLCLCDTNVLSQIMFSI